MVETIFTILAAFLVPLLQIIFEKIAKRKLDDKEFIEYITAHQKKRSQAGHASMSWEDAIKKAQEEMKEEEKIKEVEKQENKSEDEKKV